MELLLDETVCSKKTGPEAIKLFFMLNSTEHEILNAHKYKNIKKFVFLGQISLECYFSCSEQENFYAQLS